MTERELKKLAKKKGFIKTAFGKGSHEVWKHPDGRTVTIPKPKENDYRPGTLGKILKVLEGGVKNSLPYIGAVIGYYQIMKYTYLALFEVDRENGGYTITFPDFQGAISEADTLNEAIYNAREVLEIYTVMFEDEDKEFPEPSSFKALASQLGSDEDILQAISVDTELVRERERSKVVNKTVTLPNWLVEVGKENKINFSQLLQKAIREELQV